MFERVAADRRAPITAQRGVVLRVLDGGQEVHRYSAETDTTGMARFDRVLRTGGGHRGLRYEAIVTHKGVSFPFRVPALPAADEVLELDVPDVRSAADGLESLSIEHTLIEIMPYEDVLAVRHALKVHNAAPVAINLGAASPSADGLAVPLPDGIRHPELHEDAHGANDGIVELRGTTLHFVGAVPPSWAGPLEVRLIYTIKYGPETIDWIQKAPVATRGARVAVWRSKMPGHRKAVPLILSASAAIGRVESSELPDGRQFWMLQSPTLVLRPGEPFEFGIGNLPTLGRWKRVSVVVAMGLIAAVVLLGFRRSRAQPGEMQISRSHLEAERTRLIGALGRMGKALKRGRITEARFERERDAITARLVSLYRALDRLDPK